MQYAGYYETTVTVVLSLHDECLTWLFHDIRGRIRCFTPYLRF